MSDTPLPSFPADEPGPKSDPPTFLTDALNLLRQLKLTPSAGGDSSVPNSPHDTPDALPTIPGYEILCELGRGGMGVVYKARQTGLNRVVALKMILGAKNASENELLRFLAEAEAVAAVRHPNVVEVYELGQCGRRPYFAMEFVPDGSLADLLRGTPARPPVRATPTETAALLAAVARGVHAAHQADIVHRDLKPGNILLSGVRSQESGDVESGDRRQETGDSKAKATGHERRGSEQSPVSGLLSPKVSDFGLAKRLSSDLTRTLAVMGTPHYMAPEQAGGKAKFVGPAADIYALGVILYECLAGSVPFSAVEPWSVLRKVIDDAPTPPSARVPGVPRDVELICLKCLEKEPHHRYPTAAALADDLEAFADGRAVSVRPVGAVTRLWRWSRRNPAQAALAAVLLLLALVVPPVVVWNRGQLAESAAAADGAKAAQAEAEKLAAARDLFGLTNAVRRRSVDRPTGWTWDNAADLTRAALLAAADRAPLTDLRSEAAVAALAADLRPADPQAVSKKLTASVAVTSPDGLLIATGEFKARGLDGLVKLDLGLKAKVRLVDALTGGVRREFAYPVGFAGGGAQDGTRALAFSPDGRTLFAGTRGGVVYRFDLDKADDQQPKKWPAFKTEVSQLATSPDGKSVYGRTLVEKPIHRWDAATGKLLGKFEVDGGVTAFAVHPDTGDVLAADGSHFYRLAADLTPRGAKQPVGDGHPRILAFACGRRILIAACFETLVLFDPATLAPAARFVDPDLRRGSHQEDISSVAVHPTGAFVATACSNDDDRRVKVWEVASGRRVAAVGVAGTGPISVAWSGDGRTLHATAPNQLLRFAFAPPPAERFACFHPAPLDAAALAPDAVAAVGLDPAHPDQRALIVTTPAGTTTTTVPGESVSARPGVAFDPHPERAGRVVLTAKNRRAFEWSPGKGLADLPASANPPSNPRFAPDGSRLWLTVAGSATTWDGTGREPRGTWTSEFAGILSGLPNLNALAVGPTRAVAGGRDGSVFVLKPEGKSVTRAHTFPHPGDPVSAVALAPDESVAAVGTRNGRLRLCRLADESEVALDAHAGAVVGVSFRRDGEVLATGGKDRVVRFWRRTGGTFEPLFAVSNLPSAVLSVEFSWADDRLLVLLTNEHAARVWDTARLREHLDGLGLGW